MGSISSGDVRTGDCTRLIGRPLEVGVRWTKDSVWTGSLCGPSTFEGHLPKRSRSGEPRIEIQEFEQGRQTAGRMGRISPISTMNNKRTSTNALTFADDSLTFVATSKLIVGVLIMRIANHEIA